MGLGESFIKNVFCDIVKPRIGSVVKVDLLGKELLNSQTVTRSLCHTGIYIGNDEIVEWANIDGTATVRIVSAEEFIEGDDCISRTGLFIYVACKQDRNGNCIAMGSQDIAERAKSAVGETSKYRILFNNCHMFTQYCITGKKSDCSTFLSGVEVALDNKFIEHDHERLLDMWRSTGESRGRNPCFVDSEEDNEDAEEINEDSDFEELLEKAENGDAESQFQVGRSYFIGDGVEDDEEEAVHWYEEAAENGHIEAMYELGQCYSLGMGVEEDEEEAVSWYRKAARKKHPGAMYELANCYYYGNGVTENVARAKEWYRKAAEAGDKDAKAKLKNIK